MAEDNVRALPGCKVPDAEPNTALIQGIEKLLADAKSGQLQSFVGTGFTADGLRCAAWFCTHNNVYEMLGAIAWLEHEYVHRQTRG